MIAKIQESIAVYSPVAKISRGNVMARTAERTVHSFHPRFQNFIYATGLTNLP